MRRSFLALALLCCGALAQAQAPFPSKPIRVIVTSPSGGANDILNRTLGAKLSESIGQPVLIDNKPGASGFVAAEMVARAPADGYTLLGATEATLVSNPLFFKKVPYDTQRDFAPVTMAVEVNYVLLVHPAVPANSVRELIALARSKPGALNYASSGNGSAFHLGMEMFKRMAGVDIVHVPFKGSALSVNAMLAGEVQIMLNGTPNGVPLAKSGKLRALAARARGARAPRGLRLRRRREYARGIRLPHAQRVTEVGARDTGVGRKTRINPGNPVPPPRHGLQSRFSSPAHRS